MKKAILATKVGMTQIFNEDGALTPVSVLLACTCCFSNVNKEYNLCNVADKAGFSDIRE